MTPGRRSTIPARGDVILVPVPFAELTATKARPAVVFKWPDIYETIA
jgi:hypothetical protein